MLTSAVLLFSTCAHIAAQDYTIQADENKVYPESTYPYWPSYNYLDIRNNPALLGTIQAQPWVHKDHVIEGWDWSLPSFVEPAQNGMIALQRIFPHWGQKFSQSSANYKGNLVGIIWVRWRDIEPTKDDFNFQFILDEIDDAESKGLKVVLRVLCHSKLRNQNLDAGEAPLWLEDLNVPLLPQQKTGHNLNFDPTNPVFHARYKKLVQELGRTDIPNRVKAAYVGWAHYAHGDEGIGPHGEGEAGNNPQNNNDPIVRERIDVWEQAFTGQTDKVFMGGPLDYGFSKGFGTRNGFIENYLYTVPGKNLGQYIDQSGYLCVDEEAPVIKLGNFNGEVNESYEDIWYDGSKPSIARFGNTPDSFSYRYFMSSLRLLQMRCTYVHTTGFLVPEMIPFLAQELGRTVEDTPDVWSFLNTSYLAYSQYQNKDWKGRTFTPDEKNNGLPMKNMERWLYQRDMPGYETEPVIHIQHSIKMWMVQQGKPYDWIARKGKRIGFDVDDRWDIAQGDIAIKVSYFDNYAGQLNLVCNNDSMSKAQLLSGDGKLKTATFFVSGMESNTMGSPNFDFVLKAGGSAENIVISMVRIVKTNQKTE